MYELYNGDCLEVMDKLINLGAKVDMVLCDPPYGTTGCKWDSVIPFNEMWERVNKLIKPNGAIVLFGSEPFSTELRHSNLKMFKYDWIWDKKIPSGMSYARFQPMRQTENISVFCKGKTVYNPQMIKRDKPIKGGGMSKGETTNNQKLVALHKTYDYKNPTNILIFDKIRKGSLHPTQKPVELCEYLIKTYTNEGEIVLDNCMGSGSTVVACVNTNRHYIGFELNEQYFKIAKSRISDVISSKSEVVG